MSKKKKKTPKIEVLKRPIESGNSVHIRVRFNYENASYEYGFNIPMEKLLNKTLEEELKELYEEKKPRQVDVSLSNEIDW